MTYSTLAPPFAQAAGGPRPEEVAMVVTAVLVGITAVAGLALQVLFLITLKRALDQCAPHNRQMEPGQVFLNLIPCYGAVWMFFTVSRVSKAVRDEFDERGVDENGDFGQQLGITYAALALASTVSAVAPYVAVFAVIPAVICWVMYWVKIAGYARTLREGASFREERDDFRRRRRDEQREDDRRRRDREDDARPPRRRSDE